MTKDGMPPRFDLILADPPWRYENAHPGRRIENHYPTMEIDTIKGLPVARVAARDCVLFLWASAPKLAEAMEVIPAWGFRYRTGLVWHKLGALGMGHYARIDHEHLLIAIRGSPGTPLPGRRPRSVLAVPKGRHSRKPRQFHELIERMYPTARKLELFSRFPRPGWAAWGNEAEGLDPGPLLPLDLPRGQVLTDLFSAGAVMDLPAREGG